MNTILIGAGVIGIIYYYMKRRKTILSGITCTSFNVTNDAYSYSFNSTWTNFGSVLSTFTPSLIVNGITYPISGQVTLTPNQQYNTGWVTEAIAAGTYTICPVPTGTGISCQTVNISVGS